MDRRSNTDTRESLGAEGEEQWERLRSQLDKSSSFWLGFVFCSSPRAADILQQRTERMLRSLTRTLEELRPGEPHEMNLILPLLLNSELKRAGCVWVSAVRADPPGRPGAWSRAWDDFLLRTNERRDAIRRHITGGLVLAGTTDLKPRVREIAPDLWSVRSLVLDMPATLIQPERRGRAEAALSAELKQEDTGLNIYDPISQQVILDPEFALSQAQMYKQQGGEWQVPRANALLKAVPGLLYKERTPQAVIVAREAVDILQRERGVSDSMLAGALAQLAAAEEADGDLAAAAEHVERAIRLQPPGRDRDLAAWYDRAGKIALARADVRYAADAYGNEVEALRRVLHAAPAAPTALRELERGLLKLSDAQLDAGNPAAAVRSGEEALVLARRLQRDEGDSPAAMRDLSMSLNRIGNACLRMGELARASAAYEEALSLRRKLCRLKGNSPDTLRDLSLSLNRLGMVRRQTGELDSAVAAYGESLALRRQLRQIFGDTPEVLRDLSVVVNRLGDILRDKGDIDGAERAYEESHRLARTLCDIRGENPETLRDLSIVLSHLGALRQMKGELHAAAAVYEESLDITQRLFEAQGASAKSLTDLAEGLFSLGAIRLELRQLSAARDLLAEADATVQMLLSLAPTPEARLVQEKIQRELSLLSQSSP